MKRRGFLHLCLLSWIGNLSSHALAGLPDVIEKVKPSVVAIGSYDPTRSPPYQFLGTGFVVAEGNWVVTNAHVVRAPLDAGQGDKLTAVAKPSSGQGDPRQATLLSLDVDHDLALLNISGLPLPPMTLAPDNVLREGDAVAFTGFPLIGILGPYPATHRGIVAAITPIAIPGANASQLSAKLIRRLAKGSFNILQLDATAYPGDSGSPLYDPENGRVVGIINMVLVKGTKESVLTHPSGVTYAIPVKYLRELLQESMPPPQVGRPLKSY